MSRHSFTIFIAMFIALGLRAQAANAHSDVLVANVAGQATVGAAEDIDGPDESFDLSTRVFESILRVGFAPPTPGDYEGDEPGFFALHGGNDAAELASLGAAPLPGGAAVTASAHFFTINAATDALFFWNGVGSVDFQPISVVQPGVTLVFDPPSFGVTASQGSLDAHPVYELDAAAGTPADGAYLISPRISVAGLAPSDPFYMVMLADSLIIGESQAEAVEAALEALEGGSPDAVVDFGGGVTKDFEFYEAAVEWVQANLVIPEPSSASMVVVGAFTAARFRRERGWSQ